MLAQTALQIRALRPLTGSAQPTEIALTAAAARVPVPFPVMQQDG